MKNELRIRELNFEQIKKEITTECDGKVDLKNKEELQKAVADWMKKEK